MMAAVKSSLSLMMVMVVVMMVVIMIMNMIVAMIKLVVMFNAGYIKDMTIQGLKR